MLVKASLVAKSSLFGAVVWFGSNIFPSVCTKAVGWVVSNVVSGMTGSGKALISLMFGIESIKALADRC